MKQHMQAHDSIRVHVECDGDVILTKVPHDFNKSICFEDLFFGLTEIAKGSLDKELVEYGVRPEIAREGIDRTMIASYYEEVTI